MYKPLKAGIKYTYTRTPAHVAPGTRVPTLLPTFSLLDTPSASPPLLLYITLYTLMSCARDDDHIDAGVDRG